MRNTQQCPKCESTDVIMIEGQRFNQTQIISLTKWGAANAVLDRYLCANCGFTEEWIQLDKKFMKWVEKARDKGNFRTDYV